MSDVQSPLSKRIHDAGAGKVFTPKDFLDLGSREAVDQALSRLVKSREISRLGRGLYTRLLVNPRLGIPVSPDTEEVVAAMARQTGSRVIPSGAVAANQLGLSTQVPAKLIYLTDGRTRQVRIGKSIFVIKHVSPKQFPSGNRLSALVIQALRYLGCDAVDSQTVSQLRRRLSIADRNDLQRDGKMATGWIADVIRQIAVGDQTVVSNHG